MGTLGLDPQTRRRVWDYLTELRTRESLTVFLTTHYLDEAEQCDRIAVIDHGEIVALDSPANLKSVVGSYGFRSLCQTRPGISFRPPAAG